jgi:hypothetical protein
MMGETVTAVGSPVSVTGSGGGRLAPVAVTLNVTIAPAVVEAVELERPSEKLRSLMVIW